MYGTGDGMILTPSERRTSSNRPEYLASRSRIRKRTFSRRSATARFLGSGSRTR